MKKYFILFMMFFVTVFLFGFTSQSQFNGEVHSEIYFDNLSDSVNECNVINDHYKLGVKDTSRQDNFIYTDDYSGIFLDDEGYLNLMVIDIGYQDAYKLIQNANLNHVKLVEVKYTYNQLQLIQDKLASHMAYLGISSLGINQSDNCIDVFINEKADFKAIYDYIDVSFEDCDILQFIYNDKIISHADELMAGTRTWYTIYLFFKAYGTVGANAVDNVTGEKGILTNAHVAVEDKTMKHSLGTIGVRSKGFYGDTIDAAFVPFEDESDWIITGSATYGDQSVIFSNIKLGNESYIVEGYPVTKLGYTTNRTDGVITHTDYTTNFTYSGDSEPTQITNVIRYSNASISGDSGGPVYFNGGTKSSKWLIAINYAGPADPDTFTFGIGCRITNIISALDITIITNDNEDMY